MMYAPASSVEVTSATRILFQAEDPFSDAVAKIDESACAQNSMIPIKEAKDGDEDHWKDTAKEIADTLQQRLLSEIIGERLETIESLIIILCKELDFGDKNEFASKCKEVNEGLDKVISFLDSDFKKKKEIAMEWGHDLADFTEDVWEEKLEPFFDKVADESEESWSATKSWFKKVWQGIAQDEDSQNSGAFCTALGSAAIGISTFAFAF
uniref:Uncharacterized protein n=1 Tax=Favella ehrenbergii TaxID=182087 RepID=A0A7S3MMS5_9SPIT|mmetsp:Transcript_30736/g.38030  ORF Transcript_30736/g.38030 Transcript_30736/m.38030 type:complete len:210 (+) Transcript_30736:2-631(+)